MWYKRRYLIIQSVIKINKVKGHRMYSEHTRKHTSNNRNSLLDGVLASKTVITHWVTVTCNCHWNKSIERAFSFSKNWAKEIPDCTEQTVQGMAKAPSTTTLRQVRTIKTINKEPTKTDSIFFS